MGHRCRESLGAVFQPRRSRATSLAPFLGQRGAVGYPAAGPYGCQWRAHPVKRIRIEVRGRREATGRIV